MDFLEYELKIDFERNTPNPARVFHSMAGLIDSFHCLDSNLVSLFDFRHESQILLGDIQTGSLKTIIKTVLESVDDNALLDGNWNQVLGRFIHRVKHRVLDWCKRDEAIDDPREVLAVTHEIDQYAQDTGVQFIPEYRRLHPGVLIQGIQAIKRSTTELLATETVYYGAHGDVILVNRDISFSREVLDEYLAPRVQIHREDAVLTIKKPDYLGDSQWDFKCGQRAVRAHIEDGDWLTSFRRRQFQIKPGDALRVFLETRIEVDADGNELEPRYQVLKVYGIVPGDDPNQMELPVIGR